MITAREVYTLKSELHTAEFNLRMFCDRWEAGNHLGSITDNFTYRDLAKQVEVAQDKLAAGESEIGGRVYRVPVENLYSLEERVAKINKRVAKTGTDPVVLTVTDEIDKREETSEIHGEVVKVHHFAFVILSGQTARIGGYEFVAVIQHTDEGNIIREIPPIAQEVRNIKAGDLTPYIKADPICDHCGLDRRRKDTFIVQSREGGKLIQVGRNCLGDFTGIHNPDQAARYAEYLIDLDAAAQDAEREPSSGGGESVTAIDEFLTHVVTCIRQYGWVSGSTAYNYGGEPTKHDASRNLRDCRKAGYREPGDRDGYVLPTQEDRDEAETVVEWARETYTEEAVEAAITAGNTDEAQFLNNMRVGFAADYIGGKVEGYVAYGVMARRRSMEKQVREEKIAKAKEGKGYVGEVGQKGFETEVTLAKVVEIQDRYSYNGGTKPLYIFVDSEGNDVKWFASDWVDAVLSPKLTREQATEQGVDFDGVNRKGEAIRLVGIKSIGTTYKIRGTVKAHEDGKDQYTGEQRYAPATLLTRCKLTEGVK